MAHPCPYCQGIETERDPIQDTYYRLDCARSFTLEDGDASDEGGFFP